MDHGVAKKYVSINHPTYHELNDIGIDTETRLVEGPDSQFSVHYDYSNGLKFPVTVVDRQGMRIELPSSMNPQTHDFLIKVRVVVGKNVKINIDDLLNSSSPAAQTIGGVIQNGGVIERFDSKTFVYHYSLNERTLAELGSDAYLTNLDIVVTTLLRNEGAKHPFSDVAIRNKLVEDNHSVNDSNSFGYGIKIVDNQQRFGDRFVNISGQVYKVPATIDELKYDGIYVTTSGGVNANVPNPKPTSVRYDLDDEGVKENLRLYQTIESAKVHGDELAEWRRRLEEQSHKIREEEQRIKEDRQKRQDELDEYKYQRKIEEDKREEERKEREARLAEEDRLRNKKLAEEEHQRNLEALERKQIYEQQKSMYEHRSMERKDSHETVKLLPALVTGAAALFIAFSKLGS